MKDLNNLYMIRKLVFIVILSLIGFKAYGQVSADTNPNVASNVPSTEENLLCGDLNQDGELNVLDIINLVDHILQTSMLNCDSQGDLNKDEFVNIADIIILINAILGDSSLLSDDCSCEANSECTPQIIPTSSNSPGAESSVNALDGNLHTKYLNFDKEDSGFTHHRCTESVVTGLVFSSANDAPDRDPTSFLIEGSNDNKNFTEIAYENIPNFDARHQSKTVIFENDTSYKSYRITFPTINGSTCCMQIAEVEYIEKSFNGYYDMIPSQLYYDHAENSNIEIEVRRDLREQETTLSLMIRKFDTSTQSWSIVSDEIIDFRENEPSKIFSLDASTLSEDHVNLSFDLYSHKDSNYEFLNSIKIWKEENFWYTPYYSETNLINSSAIESEKTFYEEKSSIEIDLIRNQNFIESTLSFEIYYFNPNLNEWVFYSQEDYDFEDGEAQKIISIDLSRFPEDARVLSLDLYRYTEDSHYVGLDSLYFWFDGDRWLNPYYTPDDEIENVDDIQKIDGYWLSAERHYVHDGGALAGLTTWRVYLNCINEDDYLSSVSGDSANVFELKTTTSWYQDPFPQSAFPSDINPIFYPIFPELEYDSWLTIGTEDSNGGFYISSVSGETDPFKDFEDGNNMIINDATGSAWYILFPGSEALELPSFAGDDLKILIAQLTTDGEISGQMQIQIFKEADQSKELIAVFPINVIIEE